MQNLLFLIKMNIMNFQLFKLWKIEEQRDNINNTGPSAVHPPYPTPYPPQL